MLSLLSIPRESINATVVCICLVEKIPSQLIVRPLRSVKQKTIGPYSIFRLETRFWGQNDKNLNNFGVITDMVFKVDR